MFHDYLAMILDYALFPLLSVARLRNLGWNAVCVFVGHDAAVLVLRLHVSVDELHEKKLLKSNPLVEDLLCIVDREGCEIFTY